MPANSPVTASTCAPEPFLGFGLGLRTQHFQQVLEQSPAVDWFEVVSENFMVAGGKPRYFLRAIGERYPLVMHGVSLSIGSADPLNFDYLKRLKRLAEEVQPAWISDHLCWTGVDGRTSHDLLPLPYAEEVVDHVVERVRRVQDFLGRQLLLENVSSYLTFAEQSMAEWEFIAEVCARADCLMLLDINNVYVSARNHGFDARDYIDYLDPARVQQFHLAGHSDYGDYVIDTHDHDVPHPVWQLYRHALRRFGPVSTLIERDDNIPALPEMIEELDMARQIYAEECAAGAACAP
ncbi:DUF692 domain-containing protein [Microbulbifer marinus]|uniref:UPF0276 protein SAMN05216562_3139 n=1 Tax=Microbulbifer marinus TaxID=658218 RepID=A0A1H4B9H0_9GAMM|nr:DUF692 domain-containing protein [Microbulbifer marinus]SEA44813.1 hypothetical protein SAMN05216562_3139 [Microbulbifer marinus]